MCMVELIKKQQMIDVALQKLVSEIIGKDDYNRIKFSLSNECTELQMRIEELKGIEEGFIEYSKYGLSLLSNLSHYYNTSNLDGKQRILSLVFNGKLIFHEKSYRTKEPNEILDLLCRKDNGLGGSEIKKSAKKSALSFRVARRGRTHQN